MKYYTYVLYFIQFIATIASGTSLINRWEQEDRETESEGGGRFPKGVSGNPKGRPKSGEALTELFREYLEDVPEGEAVPRKRLLVRELYRRAMGGETTDGSGKTVKVQGSDDLLRYAINRLDGMPKRTLDIDESLHAGDGLTVFVGRVPVREQEGEEG